MKLIEKEAAGIKKEQIKSLGELVATISILPNTFANEEYFKYKIFKYNSVYVAEYYKGTQRQIIKSEDLSKLIPGEYEYIEIHTANKNEFNLLLD